MEIQFVPNFSNKKILADPFHPLTNRRNLGIPTPRLNAFSLGVLLAYLDARLICVLLRQNPSAEAQ